jgi:hypothetical protein
MKDVRGLLARRNRPRPLGRARGKARALDPENNYSPATEFPFSSTGSWYGDRAIYEEKRHLITDENKLKLLDEFFEFGSY